MPIYSEVARLDKVWSMGSEDSPSGNPLGFRPFLTALSFMGLVALNIAKSGTRYPRDWHFRLEGNCTKLSVLRALRSLRVMLPVDMDLPRFCRHGLCSKMPFKLDRRLVANAAMSEFPIVIVLNVVD